MSQPRKVQNALYYQRHRAERAAYKRTHPRSRGRKAYDPDKAQKYYEAHREERIAYGRRRYSECLSKLHPTHYLKGVSLGYRKRHEQAAILRGIVLRMVSGKHKKVSGSEYIGCSSAFLRNHLESQFKPDMTWANRREWHVDHIIPLSLFPMEEDPSLLFVASHWTNLQPLWGIENRKKGDRYIGVTPEALYA